MDHPYNYYNYFSRSIIDYSMETGSFQFWQISVYLRLNQDYLPGVLFHLNSDGVQRFRRRYLIWFKTSP